MSLIQIRGVPEQVHRTLKARAAQQGLTLSDYLLAEIRRVAERPTIDEVLQRIKRRGSVTVSVDPARAIRREREAR